LASVENLVPVLVPVTTPYRWKTLTQKRFGLEARVGIGPAHVALTKPCLTAWRSHHQTIFRAMNALRVSTSSILSCPTSNSKYMLNASKQHQSLTACLMLAKDI